MIFQKSPKLSLAIEICRRLIGKLFHKRGLATAELLSINIAVQHSYDKIIIHEAWRTINLSWAYGLRPVHTTRAVNTGVWNDNRVHGR